LSDHAGYGFIPDVSQIVVSFPPPENGRQFFSATRNRIFCGWLTWLKSR
jgi:hypothetical protein